MQKTLVQLEHHTIAFVKIEWSVTRNI